MMKVVKAKDLKEIVVIAIEWQKTCNGKVLGIELDAETYFNDLAGLIAREDSELLLLEDNGEVIGYMGIEGFDSPLGRQKIANEHYWYISEKHRGRGSILLIEAARNWAKEKGCSHLVMNASTLASDLHDKVCKFYERLGLKKFETSYIEEII